MTGRDTAGLLILVGIAAATAYLANSMGETAGEETTTPYFRDGYYLRSARILGTGADGQLLYEIEAAYAQQRGDDAIEFEDVHVAYATESGVPWTLDADTAVISNDRQHLVLEGHVIASAQEGPGGEVTEIRTPYLELLPEQYRAETNERVQVRIGSRSLTATGMLASLNENRFSLKSNVSGKFVP